MPIMTYSASVAANTTVANVLAGQSKEFITEPSVVTLAATGSAAGLNVTMIIGDEIVVDDQAIGAQNHFPVIPDDVLAQGGGFPGDRIVVKVRNTTAGALTPWIRVDVEPA
jgi:hypothetical protein